MVKKKNVTTKQWLSFTEKALRGCNGQEVWDIMTAMRGPDSDSEDGVSSYDMKHNTTEIIRYQCFGDAPSVRGGANINRYGTLEEVEEYSSRKDGHFFSHIRHAAESLRLAKVKRETKPKFC